MIKLTTVSALFAFLLACSGGSQEAANPEASSTPSATETATPAPSGSADATPAPSSSAK